MSCFTSLGKIRIYAVGEAKVMKLPEIFPPADLIERVKGVKRRLRQRPRLGRLGWAGFLMGSTIRIGVVAVNSPFARAGYDME